MNVGFTIPGKPIGKARPRFYRRGKFTGAYSAQETEEGRCLFEVYRNVGEDFKPLTGPLKLVIDFFVPRPKNHYGTGKNAGNLKKTAPKYPITKPDTSNCIKFYEDCFNGIVWEDDKQICAIYSRRRYAERPRTEIFVEEII